MKQINYYIGDPVKGRAGYNKRRRCVQCQLWLTIDKVGKDYRVLKIGGVVHRAPTLKAAKLWAYEYARQEIRLQLAACYDLKKQLYATVNKLGGAPANLNLG